jgi:glucuronate isomerase
VGTTDDPADSLEWHQKAAGETETKILPSFRPDKILNIEKPDFAVYISKLAAAAGRNISSLEDLLAAVRSRIDFFDTLGCRASDHALEFPPCATASADNAGAQGINYSLWEKEVKENFAAALAGKTPDSRGVESWKTYLLNFLGAEYANRGWAMQIHLAAIRSVNSAAFKRFGPDTGYDAVHDHGVSAKLARLLDLLDSEGKLPKTILYSLNIKDFYTLGTIMGCFQGEADSSKPGIPGKLQLGSAWWFLDHIDGMEAQMKILGNVGLLSRFVGMLTDSRSFLSYPRHEYFRRILCNILGNWAENGEIPCDFELLSGMVKDISFRNAERYFEK